MRIKYDEGRDDEHYQIIDGFLLEGIVLMAHSGKKGVFKPEDLLLPKNAPYWEIFGLDPKVWISVMQKTEDK